MDASSDDLRDRYLAALAAGESAEKIWHLIIQHPWYRQQSRWAAARAVHVLRLSRSLEEDVQDEAMLLLADKLEEDPYLHLNPVLIQTKFAGWMVKITYRDCVEVARGEQSQSPPHFEIHPTEHATYHFPECVEIGLDIDSAVRRLPPEQRTIIQLWFDGYRVDQIALLRREPYKKTHRQHAAALKELRRILG